MRNVMTLGLTMCMLLALAACGGGNNGSSSSSGGGGGSGPDFSTPKGTMTEVAAAFAANDIDRLMACYDKDFLAKKREDGKTEEEKMRAEFKEIADDGMKIAISFEDADIKIEGDKASVKTKMKITMKDGKTEDEGEGFELVKKGDVWKCVK
ncbi:MAG: nuclear transport factor 2 family protein [Planctomycetes bacterium]|nr:nuclear transport factor 2 family protein [Planctomycetota bacterium]